MDYPEISTEEASSLISGQNPKLQAMETNEPSTPVKPPKVELGVKAPVKAEIKREKELDVVPLTSQVNNALENLKADNPTPVPNITDNVGNILDIVQQHWGMVAPAAALGFYKLGKHMAEKEVKPTTPIDQRQITRIEPKMDESQVKPEGRIEPTFEMPTNPQMQNINTVAGGPVHTRTDAEMIAKSENNKAIKSGQPLPYPEMQTTQQVAKEVAPQAPITADTSPQEAETLANVSNAAQTPSEAVSEPSKEVKGAVKPKKKEVLPEGMTKEQFAMKNHLLGLYGGKNEPLAHEAYDKVLDILGYTPAFPPGEGGSITPEEKAKVLEYRKANLEGPKINLTHDMKKVIKAGGIASLLSLPAFLNAKTLSHRKAALSDLGESMLPIGATPTTAGAPTLPPSVIEAQRQATLLGSPYHKFK